MVSSTLQKRTVIVQLPMENKESLRASLGALGRWLATLSPTQLSSCREELKLVSSSIQELHESLQALLEPPLKGPHMGSSQSPCESPLQESMPIIGLRSSLAQLVEQRFTVLQ
ncbi:hypothetical protein C4K24_1923 [Pseudomonas chlororaphis subsp. aurantiaca]|nr:hypothetical protein C4K24_1923 [Pseudomonas chlororaphis subsp. aurantiaca]